VKFKLTDIELAYEFVNDTSYGEGNFAILCKETGKLLFQAGLGDEDEIRDEDLTGKDCIEIPSKNDLDLGEHLVFRFVASMMPEEYRRVRNLFGRRGAYRRFKTFLESKGLLKAWYDFEGEQQERALRKWCEENGIELAD
jgi:hypothetical protein